MKIKLLLKSIYCMIFKLKVNLLIFFLLVIQLKSFSQGASLIFKDDFKRDQLGEAWQASPSWSILDGAAHNYIDGIGGTLRSTENFEDLAYVIETSSKGFTNNYWREFRITFGQQSLSNENMYVLSYTPNSGGQLTLAKSTGNVFFPEPLDEIIIYPDLASEKWYKFKIAKYRSGLIQVFLDKGNGYTSIPLLETIDLSYPNLGHFGWQEDTQTAAESFYVDWIEVREPESAKPAVKEKPLEDNLITQVSAESGKMYKVAKLNVGVKTYNDSEYTITSVPDFLKGASFIQTANNDRLETSSTFLTSFIKKDAIIYIAYDPKASVLPGWLQDWEKTGDIIGITDPESNYYEVYSKVISSGEVYPRPFICGGNLERPAQGAEKNYLVVALEIPGTSRLEAENASLFGAKVENVNYGFSGTGYVDFVNLDKDFIEWTVQIDVPGSYNLGITFANGSKAPRPLNFTIDGKDVTTYPFESTSSWESWQFYNGPAVYLTRGLHKIRATAVINSGPNVDYISLYYVSPTNTTVPDESTIASTKSKIGINSLKSPLEINPTMAYPNPFVDNTTIVYSLKEKMPVNLTVFDIRGTKIEVLTNEIQEVGDYKVIFKGDNLQKGLYIYKLRTGKKVKTVKLLKR